MRRMLVNAQKPEQLRVAVVQDSRLESYQLEVAERGLTRGNIYRGIIASIQPSLNAAFIEYGAERHGFLAIQDVVPEARYKEPDGGGRGRIEEVLQRGKPIVVQVTREPEGQKGAALTTNLSLAGRYLVLTPFDDSIGVSRKVEDDAARRNLKEITGKLDLPNGCGAIIRTNAADQTQALLKREVKGLLRLWKQIQSDAPRGRGPKLLYGDQGLAIRALRDSLDSSVDEILVDSESVYAEAEEYMKAFMPRSKTRLIHYTERMPLFSRYSLEHQIEAIYKRSVPLPSGGSIVIDPTEALTAIDVNSGRSTKGSTQEETAVATNMEAAAEVARQLMLRDIGGLVVVDFIDMRSGKHQRKVEKQMRDHMKPDQARSSVGRVSSNGLLEINRQRIRQAIEFRTHRTCPTCDGTGSVPSLELVGLNLVRRIESRAADGSVERVKIELNPAVADALQNSRRRQIVELEEEFDLTVEVVSSPGLPPTEERIDWIARRGEARRKAASQQTPSSSGVAVEVEASQAEAASAAAARNGGAGDEGEGEGEGEEKSKGRSRSGRGRSRRRRSRRRSSGESAGGSDKEQSARSEKPAAEKESEKDAAADSRAAAGPAEAAGGDGERRPTRRRRGRRRKAEE